MFGNCFSTGDLRTWRSKALANAFS